MPTATLTCLFAIEGLVSDFVRDMPWFAGYSSVMVNVSDIYAMGGRPIAVVDALWSDGLGAAEDVLAGMAAASSHMACRSSAVIAIPAAIRRNWRSPYSGARTELLSSFNARPGDRLMMAVDLRGAFEDPYPFWNASVGAPSARLRADLELLPMLAESGLCDAAKDISMAGALGTALMLLECSRVGASIDLIEPAVTAWTRSLALVKRVSQLRLRDVGARRTRGSGRAVVR